MSAVGPIRAASGRECLEVELVDLGGSPARSMRRVVVVDVAKLARRPSTVWPGRAFRMREVVTPHDAIDAEHVDPVHLVWREDAGTDEAVALEVLERCELQGVGRRGPEHHGEVQLAGVVRVARLHDPQLPCHAFEVFDDPSQPGHLGPHDDQIGVPIEDASDDEVAHREAGPELVIDVGHRLGRVLSGAGVGAAGTLVLMDRQLQLCRRAPQRVVALVVVGLDGVVGWDGRQHHSADRGMSGGPLHLRDGGVDVVGKELDQPSCAVRCLTAEVDEPPIVRLEPGPPAFEAAGRVGRR